MIESEFLKRMDERLTRSDEQLALLTEEVRRSREAHADLRQFTRDLTRHNERVMQAMIDELGELSDQTRASTNAVLQVLDRLGPPA